MADATRAEDAAWLALEEIAVTVMRGNAPAGVATADQSAPAPAGVATADQPGRERIMKVLTIATNYFEKDPAETHDDVRQLVRNVRPRFQARTRAKTPPRADTPPAAFADGFMRPPASSGGVFGSDGLFGAPAATGGGIFGGPPGVGSIFGSTPPKEKK